MSIIEFKDVYKEYEIGKPIIDHLNLTIKKGEFVTLVGPSGCGKTTCLKMINKLIVPSSGELFVEGKSLDEWNTIQLRRSIGYVIQQIGLFPHMNILKNITYVLNIIGEDKDQMYKRAVELVKLVGLKEEHLNRYPRELSGGQRQRIGVARALAADPDIILMDEPFGAVDEIARRSLQDELKEIHKKVRKTIIFVTHDINEALKLGTSIILMNKGKIEQIGNKEDLIFRPENDFVKNFFGLKGFKSTLDDIYLNGIYEEILAGTRSKHEIFKGTD